MNAATTTYGSILEKPLKQLTEEDISQLTREDCRKYLKDKGSFFLLSFLSPYFHFCPPFLSVPSNSVDSVEEPSPDVQVSVSAEELHGRMDPPKLGPSGEPPCVDTDNNAISPRSPCATNGAVGQMTIFYCGKVNVYEGVPPDKAQAIMNLASSPVHLPQDDTIGRPGGLWSFPYTLPALNDKDHLIPPSTTISQMMQTEKMTEYSQQYREKGNITRDPDVEGQANRKVSLQRYLEKRKDSTGSPPQHGLPPALSNSSNNQPKSAGLAVDLNDKDAQEC
ncbi:protein tify 4b [Quercus suber]|uniref:Protein TIFY n=1 Tax=Quercus suber TaxID=58331 RepID=A0AAW0IWA6_QUESU